MQVFGSNLPGHDAMFDATLGKGSNHFRKLTDFEPSDFIDQRSERRIGFAFKGNGDQFLDPKLSRLAGKDQGQGTVPGNEAQRLNGIDHFAANLKPKMEVGKGGNAAINILTGSIWGVQ